MAKATNRRFLMRISQAEHQQLAKLSKAQGRTMSAMVRWLIQDATRKIQHERATMAFKADARNA